MKTPAVFLSACAKRTFGPVPEQLKEVDVNNEMTFDYQMKKGIAETTNALKLLELVGLGEETR